MALLTREKILGTQDRSYKEISIPEWGGKVRVQSLSAREREQFLEMITGPLKKDGTRDTILKDNEAKLVSLTVVDKDGNRLFTHEDVTALSAKNAAAIGRISKVSQKLSGIGQDELEEMAKNSGAAQSGDSSSASPESSE